MKSLLGFVLFFVLPGIITQANGNNLSSNYSNPLKNPILCFLSAENALLEIDNVHFDDTIQVSSKDTILSAGENQKEQLLKQLNEIEEKERRRMAQVKTKYDSLKQTIAGSPVLGIFNDTIFFLYTKIAASIPKTRAINISRRIESLFEDDFLMIDSINCISADNTVDVVYGETIIMSVTDSEAQWHGMTKDDLATYFADKIKADLLHARKETSTSKIIIQYVLLFAVLLVVVLLSWLVGKGFKRIQGVLARKKENWFENLSYKDYVILTTEQKYKAILFFLFPLRWFVFLIIIYFTLPIVFSIFPETRGWRDDIFFLVWNPFKTILMAVWNYMPNIITIAVIYLVMKYFIKLVKYIFSEIDSNKLVISGFHSDWAMPTFTIVRFLLYAFMFVLIFPYLPGSDSNIFKGVSVFIGILFSLGSSTAIANMVAGLVITYMRPFKIGDRIKIGDVFGDVEEKTLLVTRIKTPKNEIITIPNSTVLSGNTINYSSEMSNLGLILHSTVTIGYDVPWKDMHNALIEAANRTQFILSEPKPFVLQTGLDDFYVSYQINIYTKEVKKQALIYSLLHQNIQDVCNEKGIEILSPHYRAQRDGNITTIPSEYLAKEYSPPAFNVKIKD